MRSSQNHHIHNKSDKIMKMWQERNPVFIGFYACEKALHVSNALLHRAVF